MKKIYLLLPVVFLFGAINAQFRLGTSYSLSVPQQAMADNIRSTHSFNLSFFYILPGAFDRLVIGTELGIGCYAHVTKEQELIMSDSSSVMTDVIYSSNVFNAAFTMRGNLVRKGKVIPYVNAKAGISNFFSNVYVEDPEYESGCKALERKSIINDNTFFMSYGGGLVLDLNLFAKKVEQGKCQFDISVNKIKGGNLNYINTKNIQSHHHTDPVNTAQDEKAEPVNVKFINVTTQTIHEHQVAELYNSPLRMIDVRVGMLFRL